MDTLVVANIVGYAGAVVGSCIMIPQLYTSWKTKRMDEISFLMLVLYWINSALWVAYGLLLAAPPVYITNIIAGTVITCLIIMKIMYSKKPKKSARKQNK